MLLANPVVRLTVRPSTCPRHLDSASGIGPVWATAGASSDSVTLTTAQQPAVAFRLLHPPHFLQPALPEPQHLPVLRPQLLRSLSSLALPSPQPLRQTQVQPRTSLRWTSFATPSTDILCITTLSTPSRIVCFRSGWLGLCRPAVFFLLSRSSPPRRSSSGPIGRPPVQHSEPHALRQAELARSSLLHSRTRALLSLVAAAGGVIVLENPTSSLLWADPQVVSWLKHFVPFAASVSITCLL